MELNKIMSSDEEDNEEEESVYIGWPHASIIKLSFKISIIKYTMTVIILSSCFPINSSYLLILK